MVEAPIFRLYDIMYGKPNTTHTTLVRTRSGPDLRSPLMLEFPFTP